MAEDHQTKNALALVDKDAAIYVKDGSEREAAAGGVGDNRQPREAVRLEQEYRLLALPDSATLLRRRY